jgi:hypothetical protein
VSTEEPNRMAAWFSFDDDERRDAERVEELERLAESSEDAAEAVALLGEADELRARWNEPRERFASVSEALDELQQAAREGRDLNIADPSAIERLGYRLERVGRFLVGFAADLEEQQLAADDDEGEPS